MCKKEKSFSSTLSGSGSLNEQHSLTDCTDDGSRGKAGSFPRWGERLVVFEHLPRTDSPEAIWQRWVSCGERPRSD